MSNTMKMAVILGALSAIPPIGTDLYIPAFPLICESFGAPAAQVQLSLTAMLLGLACGQVFIGPLSDIYGRKKLLLLSLVIFILSSYGCAVSSAAESFIALRFVQGISGSGGVVLSRAIAYDIYKGHELTRFIALIMVINGAAPVFAPLLGGQIINFFDWHYIFLFLGFCGLLLFLGSFFWLTETLKTENRSSPDFRSVLGSFAGLFGNRPYAACLAVHCFFMGGLFGYIAAAPFILQLLYGLTPVQTSIVFGVNGIGMIAAVRAASFLIMRFDERQQLKTAIIVSLGGSCLLLAADFFRLLSLPALLGLLFIIASCVGVGECNSFSLAMQHIRTGAGGAAGLLGIGSFLLGAAVSPLAGINGASVETMASVLIAAYALALWAFSHIPSRAGR